MAFSRQLFAKLENNWSFLRPLTQLKRFNLDFPLTTYWCLSSFYHFQRGLVYYVYSQFTLLNPSSWERNSSHLASIVEKICSESFERWVTELRTEARLSSRLRSGNTSATWNSGQDILVTIYILLTPKLPSIWWREFVWHELYQFSKF